MNVTIKLLLAAAVLSALTALAACNKTAQSGAQAAAGGAPSAAMPAGNELAAADKSCPVGKSCSGGACADCAKDGAAVTTADAGAAEKPCSEPGCTDCKDEVPVTTAAANTPYTPQAGGKLTLASGTQVPIVSVVQLDGDPKAHAGQIALEGRVMLTYADRGTFVLVDCSKEAGCTSGCCPEATLPIRLEMSNYEGKLPEPNINVMVVGTLSVEGEGYTINVAEVRSGEQVLLKQLAAAKTPTDKA